MAALPEDLLAQRNDIDALAADFTRTHRLVVPGILRPDIARQLHACLSHWPTWALVTRINGEHRNFNAAAMQQVDPAHRAELDALIGAEARAGFQYLYERHPLYDPDYRQDSGEPMLQAVRAMLQGGPFIALMRRLLGDDRVQFADGQLTRYRRGHFLTEHDDHAEGKNRVAAYVLGLTPQWRVDYGGQLQFLDGAGGVKQTFVPGFNTLSLFRVPQPHQVTAVAPYVEVPRLSITGWLRFA